MSLISPNFDVKSIIFPNFGQGPFPKITGKKPCPLIYMNLEYFINYGLCCNPFGCFISALAYIPPQKNNFTITTRTVVCQKDELEYDARAIIVM